MGYFIVFLYLICGVLFYAHMTRTRTLKTKLPMWLVRLQVVVGWFPIVIYSALTQESEVERTLNTPLKDSGLIQPLPGIEMPGKDEE